MSAVGKSELSWTWQSVTVAVGAYVVASPITPRKPPKKHNAMGPMQHTSRIAVIIVINAPADRFRNRLDLSVTG